MEVPLCGAYVFSMCATCLRIDETLFNETQGIFLQSVMQAEEFGIWNALARNLSEHNSNLISN